MKNLKQKYVYYIQLRSISDLSNELYEKIKIYDFPNDIFPKKSLSIINNISKDIKLREKICFEKDIV